MAKKKTQEQEPSLDEITDGLNGISDEEPSPDPKSESESAPETDQKSNGSNGHSPGAPAPDHIDEAFRKGVDSGDFDVAKAAVIGFSDEELIELLTRNYPVGEQRATMTSAFKKLTRDEMISLFGTHCAIWGAGLALGGRIGVIPASNQAPATGPEN